MNSGNNWAQNNSQNYANQLAAQQGLHQVRVMTHAERELLEKYLEGYSRMLDHGGDMSGPVVELANAVLLERLPPEFEHTLRELSFRAWDALDAAHEYQKKSPLGGKLRNRFHDEWKKERGKP